jgi:AcrR family transcriptional regulator
MISAARPDHARTEDPMQRKLPSPKRAQTQKRLIDAAFEVVARDGFHAASVQAIADLAGYSIGALYSNFQGKDDLFFAVFDEHVKWFEENVEAAAGSREPAEVIKDWMSFLSREPAQFLVFIEFWAYAVRKPKVRRRFAARMEEMRGTIEAALERRAESSGSTYALPTKDVALLGLSLGRGLTLEKLADPGAISDRKIGQILGGLIAGGQVTPPARKRSRQRRAGS